MNWKRIGVGALIVFLLISMPQEFGATIHDLINGISEALTAARGG